MINVPYLLFLYFRSGSTLVLGLKMDRHQNAGYYLTSQFCVQVMQFETTQTWCFDWLWEVVSP